MSENFDASHFCRFCIRLHLPLSSLDKQDKTTFFKDGLTMRETVRTNQNLQPIILRLIRQQELSPFFSSLDAWLERLQRNLTKIRILKNNNN